MMSKYYCWNNTCKNKGLFYILYDVENGDYYVKTHFSDYRFDNINKIIDNILDITIDVNFQFYIE